MVDSKITKLIYLLLGSIVLLMIAIAGIIFQVKQLQEGISEISSQISTHQEIAVKVGGRAPEFSLPDTEGRLVSLSDFYDEKLLLIFSSVNCSYSIDMYPHIKTFHEEQNDIRIIMISEGSTQQNKELIAQQGFDFPVLMWDYRIAADYQVIGTPYFYIIEGKKVTHIGVANSLQDLYEMIDKK